jgi:hypothetical protein
LSHKEQAAGRRETSRLAIVKALTDELIQSREPPRELRPAAIVVTGERSKLIQQLIAPREFQPTVLHFEEVTLYVRVRLAPCSFSAFFSTSEAFAHLLGQSLQHGASDGGALHETVNKKGRVPGGEAPGLARARSLVGIGVRDNPAREITSRGDATAA